MFILIFISSLYSVLTFWRRTLSSKPENQGALFFLLLFLLFDTDQSYLTYCPSSLIYTLFSRGQWGKEREKEKKVKVLGNKEGRENEKAKSKLDKRIPKAYFHGWISYHIPSTCTQLRQMKTEILLFLLYPNLLIAINWILKYLEGYLELKNY